MVVFSRRLLGAALLLPLAGCGLFGGSDGPPRPAATLTGTADSDEAVTVAKGIGLNLPLHAAGLGRTAVRFAPDGREASGAYAGSAPGGPIAATVRVRRSGSGGSIMPFSGGGPDATAARSAAALAAMVAAESRTLDGAAVVSRDDVFAIRFGRLQPGRRAVLTGTGELAGERRPLTVTLEAFCCIAGTWSFEYRLAAPAGVPTAELAHAFTGAIAWSREPDASVEAPE